jgi:multisubunit Na+/H+ antiporter MnhG subunit
MSELLVALLLFATAPVSAYLVARVALHRRSGARDAGDQP